MHLASSTKPRALARDVIQQTARRHPRPKYHDPPRIKLGANHCLNLSLPSGDSVTFHIGPATFSVAAHNV